MKTYELLMPRKSKLVAVKASVHEDKFSYLFVEDGITRTVSVPSRQLIRSTFSGNDAVVLITLSYVSVTINPKQQLLLDIKSMEFQGTQSDCAEIKEEVDNMIASNESQRPKRLLLFVNPISGWMNGVKLYRDIVKPVFDEFGIEVDTVVTEDSQHVFRVMESYDFTKIDGLVGIGGDGTLNQMVTGLMDRIYREAGVNRDDLDCAFIGPTLTLGQIPAGSGNVLALYPHGSMDVKTCAISIALGHRAKLDIMVLHNCETFLGYAHVLVSYGIGSKIHLLFEKIRRWARLLRYYLFPILMAKCFDVFPMKIIYVPRKEIGQETTDQTFNCDQNESSSTKESDLNLPNQNSESEARSVCGAFADTTVYTWALRNTLVNMFNPVYKKHQLTGRDMTMLINKSKRFWKALEWGVHSILYGVDKLQGNDFEIIETSDIRIEHDSNEHDQKEFNVVIDGENVLIKGDLKLRLRKVSEALNYFAIDHEMVHGALNYS